MPRNTSHGARTRQAILQAAADLATVDGLDGLSIGRLADELSMSKSGLFAHFGSKQDLQLATIEEARQRYAQEVIQPALAAGPASAGCTRCASRSCPTSSAPCSPADASSPRRWPSSTPRPQDPFATGSPSARHSGWTPSSAPPPARRKQENCTPAADPQQLAFELEAALLSANWYFHLYKDPSYLERARRAVRDRLASQATPAGLHSLPPE